MHAVDDHEAERTTDTDDDFNTDTESEHESDHEEGELRWKKPKAWDRKVRAKPFLRKLGDLVWKVPVHRDSVESEDTGLHVHPRFEMRAGDKWLPILFDALPKIAFFEKVLVKESLRYARASQTEATARPVDESLFTVGNFLRLFAVVIMRGLVQAKDNPTFFKTETRFNYVRTGAEEVCGLTLIQYQQLLRFMHLVNNANKSRPTYTDHDKCFKVRPLIAFLQKAFSRWFFPGTDNACDEAGFPSRHRWLRSYNKSKPHKYFIELLMAACSQTRFVWDFFVNESSQKVVLRQNRRRNQSKFKKVVHYQSEFSLTEREIQRKYGATAAQMVYFARKLREFDPKDRVTDSFSSTYRLFTDRRWDNIPGVVLSKTMHGVSYTATVKNGHRYHVAWQFKKTKKNKNGLSKSKSMSARGKFRVAHTKVNNVQLTTVLWVDSALVGAVSADLGTETHHVLRRRGRHKCSVVCPRILFVRGKNFRAVDQSDQLRLGKVHFGFSCRNKAWPKLMFGLLEVTLVNIYIVVVNTNTTYTKLTQEDFRWQIVAELVAEAELLDAERAAAERAAEGDDCDSAAETVTVPVSTLTPYQLRMEGRDGGHHHDIQSEYVSETVAVANQKIVTANPCARPTKRKQYRIRDRSRMDGKVMNPFHTSLGTCVVCKFFFNRPKPTKTARYCRECCTDANWPETTRAKGWQKRFHPRLCSKKCFDVFHTSRISGLDFRQHKRRRNQGPQQSPRTPAQRARRAAATASASAQRIVTDYDI